MDHQCLFASNPLEFEASDAHHKRKRPQRPHLASKATYYTKEGETAMAPDPAVRLLQFIQIDTKNVVVEDHVMGPHQILEEMSTLDREDHPRLRLIISPPRQTKKDEQGRLAISNPEAPNVFEGESFHRLVDACHFHKACLSKSELGQVSVTTGPRDLFALYFESYSYRVGWYKLSISYDPTTLITSAFLHNLFIGDIQAVTSKLLSKAVLPLTIHPMLLPVLVLELLFKQCIKDLHRLFFAAVKTQQTMGLNSYRMFAHFADDQADIEEAAERSFGDGQQLAGLEERMEFGIMAGRKLLGLFEKLEKITPNGVHKAGIVEAATIIQNRLEFLVEGLEFQMPRLRRAKAHTVLNQTGLENRTASDANKISLQIARESKADSTAMKAVAVLTMSFLPATFVAALFAMPLFDWSAPRGSTVVNDRFWVYWVVTVPGTLIVLVLWRTWWIWQQWSQAQNQNSQSSLRKTMARWLVSWWR
ncbi:MAG: hypothetical protein M1818_005789 [Claussenomyces sp. TS43310]|nr:MAG: hypothetical protein M1818_005789 [Claussenomyces sp. TS43310]